MSSEGVLHFSFVASSNTLFQVHCKSEDDTETDWPEQGANGVGP